MQTPMGSTPRWREVVSLLVGSIALTIALFADGFAFFMFTPLSVLCLASVAITGALAGHWLLRSSSATVLSAIVGTVGVLHLGKVAWGAL